MLALQREAGGGAEELGSGENADAGEGLREAAAAESARGESGEENLQRGENAGDEADGEEIVTQNMARSPGDDGYTGRLVDVAPVEMIAAGDEVEFVAEEGVAF